MTKRDNGCVGAGRRTSGARGAWGLGAGLALSVAAAAPGARAQVAPAAVAAPSAVPQVRVQFGTPTAHAGSPGATPAFVSECPMSATIRYNAAFNQITAGQDAEALSLLDAVLAECPQHPTAAELRRLAALRVMRAEANDEPANRAAARDAQPVAPPDGPSPNPFGPETAHAMARWELVSGQTVSGIALGIAGAGVAGASDGRVYTLMALLGGGAGFVGSYLGARNGITTGQAVTVNTGTYWGYVNGSLIMGSLLGSYISGEAVAGIFLGAGLIGTGAGALTAAFAQPSAYRVSMASSAGFWLGMFTFGVNLIVADNSSSTYRPVQAFMPELVAANLGFVGGIVLGAYVPVSRSRMWLIDLAGTLGGLTGFSLGLLVPRSGSGSYGFNPSMTAFATGMILGELGGLALGYYLTRNWDGSFRPPGQTAFLPVGPEGRPGLTIGLTL